VIIGYDRPYVADSPWRIRGAGVFDRNRFESYFGIGASTLGPLTFPGSPKRYDDWDEYEDALNQNVGGQTWARYNDYRKTEVGGLVTVERDFWGGWLRPQLGLQITHVDVKDYTGDTINGATMQPTRLFTDQQAGKITGFNGGWDNALKLGLTLDTRDFEPDPASGVMLQAVGRVSSEALGSAFNYQQVTLSARGLPQPPRQFWTPHSGRASDLRHAIRRRTLLLCSGHSIYRRRRRWSGRPRHSARVRHGSVRLAAPPRTPMAN
jgi:hypothetical protein